MTPLLTLDIPVRLTGGMPQAEIDVRLTPRHEGPFDPLVVDPSVFDVGWLYAEQPQIAVALDDALASAALARAAREQYFYPFQVSVGGREVPAHRMLPGSYVEESIDGVTTFGFAVPRFGSGSDRFMEPLGSPAAWLGVPGGKGAVEISAEFLTPSGRKSVPLVRDGVLDNSSGDTSTRTFAGGGAHGRVDRAPVTFQAPPGHGQTSGTVVRRLLELAGVPATKIAISGGRRLYKEITLVDANAIESANAILEPELKRVYHDERTDTWRLLDYSGVEGKRVEVVIREADVLAALGSLGDSEAADAPTAITLIGSAQVTREECGTRVEYQVIDSYAVREIRGALFTQQNFLTGALDPTDWRGAAAELRRVSRVVAVKEYDCETLVAEEVVTWGWFAPQAARYQLDADGTFQRYGTAIYLYDAEAVADDNTPAYRWISERWVPISLRRVEHEYDERGYLVGTVEKIGGWDIFEVPIKTRASVNDPWETTPYNAAWILADGRGVSTLGFSSYFHGEYWRGPRWAYDETKVPEEFVTTNQLLALRRTRSSVIIHPSHPDQYFQQRWQYFAVNEQHGTLTRSNRTATVNADGFVVAEVVEITRREPRQGLGRYLYQSKGESVDAVPPWGVMERTETRHAAAGEGRHDEFFLRFDHHGVLIESEESFGLDGYLPAAEQRQDIVPPESAFDDPAEYAFALAASRQESRPIKVRVTAPALEAVMVPWEQKGRTVQYAETEDDLAAVGQFVIREGSSIGVSVPLLFNPLIRRAHRIVLDLPTLGMHYDFLVERARHTQDERVTWTQVTGRHDVV